MLFYIRGEGSFGRYSGVEIVVSNLVDGREIVGARGGFESV